MGKEVHQVNTMTGPKHPSIAGTARGKTDWEHCVHSLAAHCLSLPSHHSSLPSTFNYFLKWPDTPFSASVLLCWLRLSVCGLLVDKDVLLSPKPLFTSRSPNHLETVYLGDGPKCRWVSCICLMAELLSGKPWARVWPGWEPKYSIFSFVILTMKWEPSGAMEILLSSLPWKEGKWVPNLDTVGEIKEISMEF